jgi:hypothetical protein
MESADINMENRVDIWKSLVELWKELVEIWKIG